MSRKPITPPAKNQVRGRGLGRIQIGTIVSHQPGTNRVDVRALAGGNRVIRNCLVVAGIEFEAGDSVLLVRAAGGVTWIAAAKVLDSKEYGLTLAEHREQWPWAPQSFTVTGLLEHIMVEWEHYAGQALCWEVQVNTQDSQEDAVSFYTYGSYLMYRNTGMVTYYFRVRSINYDVETYEAKYSGWTDWESGVSPMSAAHVVAGVDRELDELLDNLYLVPWSHFKLDQRIANLEREFDGFRTRHMLFGSD